MNRKKLMLSLSCLMMTASLIPAANAGTATGKLQVKVTIGGSTCTLKSGDNSVLDFGPLDTLNEKDNDGVTDASSGIEVQCSPGLKYRIGIDNGKNQLVGASKLYRRMSNGSSIIVYNLYRDKDRTLGWGDIEIPTYMLDETGDGTIQKFPVYGRIPKVATPKAGQYTDNLVVHLYF